MFVRIVKLSFQPNEVDTFLDKFDNKKSFIRNSKGCRLLELYRDKQNPNVFFTYSYWDDEKDLENYKNSDLFKGIWSEIKVLFNDKPLAWSVDKVYSLD